MLEYGTLIVSIIKDRIELFMEQVIKMGTSIVKHRILYKMDEQQSEQFAVLFEIYKTMWKIMEEEDNVEVLSIIENDSILETKTKLLQNFRKIIQPLTILNIFFDFTDENNNARKILEDFYEEIKDFKSSIENINGKNFKIERKAKI